MVQPISGSTYSESQGYGEQFDVEGLKFFRRLLSALQNKEFIVYFQPKVSIDDLNIAGAEALIRWNYNGEIKPPVFFIPFCERTGLVVDVDFYVLEETCRKMREWMDKGLQMVRVSVNFSKFHFNESGVAERIYNTLKKYEIPPEYIEVEFTETAYLDKEEILETTIDKLKNYGIKSSIDDFGSGYSSLNMLQNMDFEVVKLDKSLLGKGVKNAKARKVISSIIHMAKELDMEVLAEGVETTEELGLLQELKCDVVQGFLFDQPLPMDEFEKRLRYRKYPSQGAPRKRETRPMQLRDVDERDIKWDERPSHAYIPETEYPKKKKQRKSGLGFLIAGVVMFLLAFTILGMTLLLSKGGKDEVKNSDEQILYTEDQVELLIDEAKEEAKEEEDKAFITKLRTVSEISLGTLDWYRSLFPDDIVFWDNAGNKFLYIPVNKDLKPNTLVIDELIQNDETGRISYEGHEAYTGVDVSSFQGEIDWDKVKADGVDFVIIRCGLRGYANGRLVEDPNFAANIEGAKAAGLHVGVYFYSQAVDTAEAIEEADMVLELIEPYHLTGPVAIDIEQAPDAARTDVLTGDELTDIAVAFCEHVKGAGYTPMIYSGMKYFVRVMDMTKLEDYEKWFCYYNRPLYFPYEISNWQYSKSGTVDGIEGSVDLNILFKKWW
ncbi:MAG: EAL domain-containing protein [Lachnospiraceae bacterium]|nr:EAL domain-containing protein [Lachnospiraceae bacterium]